ncbi:MAG: hypothetical protein WAU82_15855 [Candidatus Binatus sp.]
MAVGRSGNASGAFRLKPSTSIFAMAWTSDWSLASTSVIRTFTAFDCELPATDRQRRSSLFSILLWGDELFSLNPPEYTCYQYGMDDPSSCLTLAQLAPDIRPTRPSAKTIFDGTKLPVVVGRPKTTSHGMKSLFRSHLICQNHATLRSFQTKAPPNFCDRLNSSAMV